MTKTYVNSPPPPPHTLLYFPCPFSFFRSSYAFLLPVMFLRSQNSSCDPHCLEETKRLWPTGTESKAPLRGNTPNQTVQENFPSGRNPPRREHRQTSTQQNKDLISRVRHRFCRGVGMGSLRGSRLEAWMKSHKSEVAIT